MPSTVSELKVLENRLRHCVRDVQAYLQDNPEWICDSLEPRRRFETIRRTLSVAHCAVVEIENKLRNQRPEYVTQAQAQQERKIG